MEIFLRQQFELLLQQATSDFAERVVYRCGGPETAVARLTEDPDGDGVNRADFVRAFFAENLLDNPAGHAFVLEALAQRSVPADDGGPVADVLARLAQAAFADVLVGQARQLILRQQVYS